MPDIAYNVPAADLKSGLFVIGVLPLERRLHGLQQRGRHGKAEWRQAEPAMDEICPGLFSGAAGPGCDNFLSWLLSNESAWKIQLAARFKTGKTYRFYLGPEDRITPAGEKEIFLLNDSSINSRFSFINSVDLNFIAS